MNKPLPWRDPVVAELHAVRVELLREHGDDLVAYSNAAIAHCRQLNFQIAMATIDRTAERPPSAEPSTTRD